MPYLMGRNEAGIDSTGYHSMLYTGDRTGDQRGRSQAMGAGVANKKGNKPLTSHTLNGEDYRKGR
jgi:hypothetical protein